MAEVDAQQLPSSPGVPQDGRSGAEESKDHKFSRESVIDQLDMHRTLTEYLKNMPNMEESENKEQTQKLLALQKQIDIASEEYTEEEKGTGPGMPAI